MQETICLSTKIWKSFYLARFLHNLIFPDAEYLSTSINLFTQQTILTTWTNKLLAINSLINNSIFENFWSNNLTELFELVNSNNIIEDWHHSVIPQFLKFLLPSDCLLSFMKLKVGISIFLLLNINTGESIYNEKRFILTWLNWHCIIRYILEVALKRKNHFIFKFRYRQKKVKYLRRGPKNCFPYIFPLLLQSTSHKISCLSMLASIFTVFTSLTGIFI